MYSTRVPEEGPSYQVENVVSKEKDLLDFGELCGGNRSRLSFFLFVLRKEENKTKKRTKREEIEKGDYGPPTRKV